MALKKPQRDEKNERTAGLISKQLEQAKTGSEDKLRVSFMLTPSTHKKLRIHAANHGAKLSGVVELALLDYFKKYEGIE